MFRRAVVFLSLIFLSFLRISAAPDAARRQITIDSLVAEHPHRSITPIWAPDGKTFVYLEDDSIHLYDATRRKDKVWFDSKELQKLAKQPPQSEAFQWTNRRVAADSYQWFPNSEDLLASVGGDLFEVFPNGHHRQITATDTPEEEPQVSPDGTEVLYRTKFNLYVIDLATGQPHQLTTDGTATLMNGKLDWVYPEELDLSTAAWWSPDSKHIAYMQFDVSHEMMYPHADLIKERAVSEPERFPQAGTPNALVKLGVIAASGGETQWMNVGGTFNTLLARVVWLPDAERIAVERLTRVQNELDLLFCDTKSGDARPILHEQSKTWINVSAAPAGVSGAVDYNLYFFKTKPEFLWTSERSGFRHIYRYSDTGKMLGQITSGDWEVKTIDAVDEAKGHIYYTASEESPLETQFYSVGVNGGERTQLTKSNFDHAIRANGDGSYFVDTYSSLEHPPATDLASTATERPTALVKPDTKLAKEYDFQTPSIVHFKAPDGTVLYAKLTKPAHFRAATKYPAIVSVYGGPQAQSVRNTWGGLNLEQLYASHGYVVWQLDNRGSYGRGHAFEATVYHRLGTQEVADQRLGVEHLIGMGFVDPERIGITGWSYGGFMTIHTMLWAPDIFKVGVAGAPVTDWHNYDTIYTERYMGLPQKEPQAYADTSNVKNAGKLQGKLLILHNFEDDNVLFQNTMQMVNALERADKQYFMQLYPLHTHGVTGELRKPLYRAMLSFFDNNLKGADSLGRSESEK
jgi:dipeptidyl-peptidase-4